MSVLTIPGRWKQQSRGADRPHTNPRRRIQFSFVVTLASVSLAIVTITTVVLYAAAIKQQRARLFDTVRSQARLMEAIARFDARHSVDAHKDGARAATLSQIIDAHSRSDGLGHTGEFALAERRGDDIVFLLSHRHHDLNEMKPVAWTASEAEPMRRALRGQSGTCTAPDYRGVMVLAAFEPVEGLNVGLVSKLDLAEIRYPFIVAGALSGVFAVLGIVVGTLFVSRISNRLFTQILEADEVIRQVSIKHDNAESDLHGALEALQVREKAINAAALLAITDQAGTITHANDMFCEISGYSRDELIGQNHRILNSGRHPTSFFKEMFATIGSGQTWRGEICNRAKDGAEYWMDTTIVPVMNDSGKPVAYVSLRVLITERKLLQSQLLHAQKMESIGQLAAGIAHEINTPIQYIGDNARFIRDSLEGLMMLVRRYREQLNPDTPARSWEERVAEITRTIEELDLEFLEEEIPKALEQSLDGVARVAEIVLAMKDFSHPGSEEKTPTDLNRAINSTITVSRNRWKYVAQLETDFEDDLPMVPCLVGELNQVILNIIVNAADAIGSIVDGEGKGMGRITVSTRRDGDRVEIRVNDTGGGIPEELQRKVFDPFFTTKEVGKGTGQGLAISHDVIVNKHGGTIELASKPGVGTTFIIRLPIGAQPTRQQKEAA